LEGKWRGKGRKDISKGKIERRKRYNKRLKGKWRGKGRKDISNWKIERRSRKIRKEW